MKAHVPRASTTDQELARFREEADRFSLRWRCRDCAHGDPSSGACSMGYPNTLLRDAEVHLDPEGHYLFCKYFELD